MRQTLPIHRFFTTILFLTFTTLTWAYDFVVDGIYYNKKTDGTSVTVTYKSSLDYSSYSGSVVIPSTVTYSGKTYNVTSIGQYAFRGSIGLKSVTIPNSVTSIVEYAFHDCTGLTSVTIGNGVTSIGNNAFSGCTGLTKAEFASIESLCKIKFSGSFSNPLYYAKHLYINGQEVTDVVIPNSVTGIGDNAFSGCTGLTSVTIPNSVTSIGKYAFSNCYGLTSVTIPESVTSIGSHTFRDCTGLTSVTIPNSVTNIGSSAFYGCICLTSVTIPNSVTSIDSEAFYKCSGLTSITIPNSVTNIGRYAFYKCKGLTSVTIGSGVTSIDSEAFYNCTGLTSVTCHAQNVPSTDSDVFDGVPQSTATLYVPKESIDAYKSTSPWSSFGTILPITPTAVESLIADEVSDEAGYTAIYDLQGRRLHEKPAHGFYIQGGKKYFVK